MGTDGFIIFIADRETKAAYNHWDSDPDFLGLTVLRWLRVVRNGHLAEAIKRLKVVSEDVPPTEAERAELEPYTDHSVGGPDEVWYRLLRQTQGDPDAILACGYVLDVGEPYGWTYTVDADTQTFAVDCGEHTENWPWSALPTDRAFRAKCGEAS